MSSDRPFVEKLVLTVVSHAGVETLDVLSETVQKPTTARGVMESQRGKQDGFEHS